MALQPLEALIETLEAGDPAPDHGTPLREQAWQFGGRLHAVAGLAPAGDPCRVGDGNVEATQLDEQPQPLDVRGP